MTTRTPPWRRHKYELTERQRRAFSPLNYHAQAEADAREVAVPEVTDAMVEAGAKAIRRWNLLDGLDEGEHEELAREVLAAALAEAGKEGE